VFKRIVLQGGGAKGLAHVGVLSAVEAAGIRIESCSGTSAGAITAALYAAGYAAPELEAILGDTDFGQFLRGWPMFRILGGNKGLYSGSQFVGWMQRLLAAKGVATFKDLKRELVVVAADLTTRRQSVFSLRETPNTRVADAVRASMSIPLIFEPVSFGESVLVDGGVLSNFPMDVFPPGDDDLTLGVRLRAGPSTHERPDTLVQFAAALVNTMMDAHDARAMSSRTIAYVDVDVGNVGTMDFRLSADEKRGLVAAGYRAASELLSKRGLASKAPSIVRASVTPSPTLQVSIPSECPSDARIRLSVAGLVRVFVAGRYLLVRGHRIPGQLQPIGGVYKFFRATWPELRSMGVTEDVAMSQDGDSAHDLRIFVPRTGLNAVLEWLASGRGREAHPWREFQEELVSTHIVPSAAFPHALFGLEGTCVTGVRFSRHLNTWEALVHDVWDLHPTPAQEQALVATQSEGRDEFAWLSRRVIESNGNGGGAEQYVLAEHCQRLIESAADWARSRTQAP
jgi:NTE family protein